MRKPLSHRTFSASNTFIFCASVFFCVSNPSLAQSTSDWYVGNFEGGTPGKNAKRLYVSCSSQSQCRISMASVSLAQVAVAPVDMTIPQKALAQTRSTYEANPGFFEERFNQDLAIIGPLLATSARFESCVDVGSIRNMFFLCATTDDPNAKNGAVILGATLDPYSESACRTKLYCEYYLVPASRK
jgi:hypothetical protein